jgi:hypothetical protein
MTSEIFVVSNYTDVNSFEVDLYEENEFMIELIKEKLNIEINDNNTLETISVTLKVEWVFTIEMRSWGVKTLSAYLTEVKDVECFISIHDENQDEFSDHYLTLDLSEFEIESQEPDEFNGQYKLGNVQINFKEKTIHGTFI